VKLFYSVSYHQNPSSATTTLEKKRRTLKLLCAAERFAKHPIYYLEDAAYRELRFEGEDVVSALAIPGARSRVIYTGTYSKPFATGARVGFGIFPEPVHTSVLHIKGNHDFGSSSLLQRLLARAIESGAYEQHLATLRRRYRHKAATMLGSLKHAFPAEVRWWEPHGGLYYWVQLPKRVRTGPESGLFRRAIRNDVLYVPGRLCYASDPSRRTPDNEMRLSFGAESEANVSKGIERLGKVIRAAL